MTTMASEHTTYSPPRNSRLQCTISPPCIICMHPSTQQSSRSAPGWFSSVRLMAVGPIHKPAAAVGASTASISVSWQ